MSELESYGQKNHYMNERQAERRPMLFKGNSIELGVRLSGGGPNGPSLLPSSNYCSQ